MKNTARFILLAALLVCWGCEKEKPPVAAKSEAAPVPQAESKTETVKNPDPVAGGSSEVTFGKKTLYKAVMPKGWKEEDPENKMRLFQAAVPKVGEDKEDAQLVIFKMSGAGGAEETLKRWQTNQWGGQDSMEERREVKTKAGAEATLAVFSGTYTAMDFAPDKKEPRENFMMLGGILPTVEGTFYIRLIGPRATVEAQREAFESMVKSLEKK